MKPRRIAGRLAAMLALLVLIGYCYYRGTDTGDGSAYATADILAVEDITDQARARGMGDDDITAVQSVQLAIASGPYAGRHYTIEHCLTANKLYNLPVAEGDRVTVFIAEENGELKIGIDDHYKSGKLMLLLVVVCAAIFAVTGFSGVKSLLSLFMTLLLIFFMMADLLLAGYPPVLLAILTSVFVTVLTLSIVAGLNRKTAAAVTGTSAGSSPLRSSVTWPPAGCSSPVIPGTNRSTCSTSTSSSIFPGFWLPASSSGRSAQSWTSPSRSPRPCRRSAAPTLPIPGSSSSGPVSRSAAISSVP